MPMKHLPNLLIVDDTKENLLFLEAVIKKIKVNLIQALSGSEALEKTRGIELALAIIDVQMPGMNGYELAVKMNEERSGNKVPVIFLTANYSNEIEAFKGYSFGAVDYLFKPFNSHILLCKINVFLDLFNQKQAIIRNVVLLKKNTDELNMINDALIKSEEKYRDLIEQANDGICIIQNGIIKYLNRRLANMWSSTVEEIIDTPFSDYIDPGYQRELADRYKQRIAGRDIRAYEITLIRKDGSKLYVEVNGTLINYKGKPADMIIARDITERKQAERELRESEEKYRNLVENISDVIYEINSQGVIVYVSPIVKDVLGYDPADVIGKNVMELVHLDDRSRLIERFSELREGIENPLEYRFIDKSGGIRWVRTKTRPIMENGSFSGARGTLIDVTERKQTEQALKESEEKYHLLIENYGEGLGVVDLDECFVFANPAAERIFGVPPGSLKGRNYKDFVSAEQIAMILQETKKRSMGRESTYEIDFITANGERRCSLVTATPQFNDEGIVIGTYGIFRDITERKQAEETLRRKDEHYKAIIENIFKFIPEGVLVFTESMSLLRQNKAFGDIIRKYAPVLGYTEEELAQKIIEQLSSEIPSGEKTEIRISRKVTAQQERITNKD